MRKVPQGECTHADLPASIFVRDAPGEPTAERGGGILTPKPKRRTIAELGFR